MDHLMGCDPALKYARPIVAPADTMPGRVGVCTKTTVMVLSSRAAFFQITTVRGSCHHDFLATNTRLPRP